MGLKKPRFSGSGFEDFRVFAHSTFVPNQEFDIASKKLLAGLVTGKNLGLGRVWLISGLDWARKPPIFRFGFLRFSGFCTLYFVPNQEFDIASKKLLAALATGDLLLFLSFIDVTEVFEFKFEAVNVLAELLSRPRWE